MTSTALTYCLLKYSNVARIARVAPRTRQAAAPGGLMSQFNQLNPWARIGIGATGALGVAGGAYAGLSALGGGGSAAPAANPITANADRADALTRPRMVTGPDGRQVPATN